MKVVSTTIRVEKTVQLKQYEPATIVVEETIELAPGDNILKVRSEAYGRISKQVQKYINHQVDSTE